MKKIDRIRQLDSSSLAYLLCIDNVGNCRSCCTVCQRFEEDNCDDNCVTGVTEWLESKEEIECDDCPHSYSDDGFFVDCAQVDENKILKQKLEKIKEIIINFSKTDIVILPDLKKEHNYKMIGKQYAQPIKDILQIIEGKNNG